MPVLKKGSAARMTGGAVVLDLADLRRQGEVILEEARRQAGAIVAAAEEDARRAATAIESEARERGRDAGYADGVAAGRAEAREEALRDVAPRIEALVDGWAGALERWEADRGALLLEAREDVLRLAIEIARRVTHRVVRMDPAVAQDQVASALKMVTRATSAVVAVHPDDLELVREVLGAILASIDRTCDVELRANPTVPPGGCIVRTAGGRIDARVDTQLDRIAESLVPSATAGAAP